jgi:hypothetical protein
MFTVNDGQVNIWFDIKDPALKYVSLSLLARKSAVDPEDLIPDMSMAKIPYWAWKGRGKLASAGVYIPDSALHDHLRLRLLGDLVL